MIVARLFPMLAFLGLTSVGLLLALLLSGALGFAYWSLRPISLTPGVPAVERVLPLPLLPLPARPVAPAPPAEGLV